MVQHFAQIAPWQISQRPAMLNADTIIREQTEHR
jgi:hypothetical protein